MGRYFYSEVHIKSPWDQVLAAFWQRYPNPYSTHVLTEDVLYREVTPSNHLLSRKLLTKTNRLPGWAERIFPAHMARAVYVLEDSIVDLEANTLITKTWNLNHDTLMVRHCDVFKEVVCILSRGHGLYFPCFIINLEVNVKSSFNSLRRWWSAACSNRTAVGPLGPN
ncbi:hypothetical protein CHARACLAT_029463 [Characodon lateralis]|uniref:PRELI/MSF1 domain-containing protein n=1 Tax=Characodon lateralis TaxID=208331 RepID=A0ABU7ENC5_9TELE|nr:hypothetical protein [Characodon lateralis]